LAIAYLAPAWRLRQDENVLKDQITFKDTQLKEKSEPSHKK
jgi:hypothetical protein